MITLSHNTISTEDTKALCNWLATEPKLTYGELTKEFEEKFADYIGSKYAIFVNSGSSANLLAIQALKYKYGYETVIIPGLCWGTDPAPAHILGQDIKFVDINLSNLSFNYNDFKDVLQKNPNSIVMMIDVLGLVPDLFSIIRLCENYNCVLLEDACEALGSSWRNKKAGTFGKIGTFSFYYSHHITTIEGGMIVTDDYDLYNLMVSCRSHGWGRDWSESEQLVQSTINFVSEFNSDFTFYHPGFNLRPTEINAFIGLRQLERIDSITDRRKGNFDQYMDRINGWKPSINVGETISCFGMPIISNDRPSLIAELKKNNIECRPLISGDISEHPVFKKYYKFKNDDYMKNARNVHNNGLYVPCHQDISIDTINQISEIINGVE